MVESLLTAIVAIASIASIASIDYCRLTGHSSYGTRNMFNGCMFNGITNCGCVVKTKTITKTITKTKTIRMNKRGNCGCRVGDSKDSGVSLALLTAIVAIASIASIASIDYCRLTGHSSYGTRNMFNCFMFNGITNSGCVVKT